MEDSEEMKKVEELEKPKNPGSSGWASVKPFVNGGLVMTLQMSNTYFLGSFIYRFHPTAKSFPQFTRQWLYLSQRMPFLLFGGVINMATLLGSYELLTRKVEALNQGRQLTLYQEASCGLIAGAIRACSCYPLTGPLGAGIAHAATCRHYYFRHIFSTITQLVRNEGVLALWRGASPVLVPAAIASNAGMLVSYDRSRIYLKEMYGLREDDARWGAGLFSGLCSGACYTSVLYAATIFCKLRSHRVKFPNSLFYALGALKPGGGFNFYSRLGKECAFRSPCIMIMWVLLENIRDAEEYSGL